MNIKDFIDKVTLQKKETVQINSLEDMQKVIELIHCRQLIKSLKYESYQVTYQNM
jgi:hypothetical protein